MLQEYGTLAYPDECENHQLAFDRTFEFLNSKREAFVQDPARRWGENPPIREEKEGESRRSVLGTYHNLDFLKAHLFPYMENNSYALQDLSLVCKAFVVGARVVSSERVAFFHHLVKVRAEFYEVYLALGLEGSIQTVQYKCCCQLWDEYIQHRQYVHWRLTAPDYFEGYLERCDLRQIVSQLPSVPMVILP